MSKEYYKKKIIDLRADIAKEKEAKKRDNERYADLIIPEGGNNRVAIDILKTFIQSIF